jgi:ABC-2 type transport system permease protein
MRALGPLVRVTVQSLLGRRRILLMLLLVALPVLVGLAIRLGGGRADAAVILDTLVIRTVLPLVALVIGSAALGSEIEDGTVVYLLVKPVPRWVVALAKIAVAVGLTLVLTVPPMLVTAVLIGTAAGGSLGPSLSFVLAAIAGGAAYASVFTTLGALTTRALVVGLAYTLLWEGVLAGLLEGTRFLSIRQATLGIAAALGGRDPEAASLEPTVSLVVLVLAIASSFVLATVALQRFQVRAGD